MTTVNSWRYQVEWRPITAPAAAPAGRWLVVVPDRPGWADHWADALSNADTDADAVADVTVVRIAAGTRRATAVDTLLAAVASGPVDGVVSLLAAAEEPDPGEPSVPAGVVGTLVLLQALGDAGITAPLWCLTTGAVSTGPADPVTRPDQAQVWGLGFVARLEHPDRWGGLVDVPADVPRGGAARLWAVLAGRDGEDQVALRPGGTHGRRVAPAPPILETVSPWRPRGTALVVGGTGALGAHVATWLAANGCEHIVLAARTAATDDAATDDPATGSAAADDLEERMAAHGAKVTVRQCDVSDRRAVAALATDLRAAGLAVRSVFHCAGAAKSTGLTDLTVQEFAEVTAAKTAGTANLDDEYGADLDAFVLFGCFPGVWGSYGRAATVAADAYLDAAARRRRALGRPATAIAWGAWAAGGTLADPMVIEQLRRGGVTPLAPDAALATMAGVLEAGPTSELVIDLDWPKFVAVFTARRPSLLIGHLATAPGRGIAELPARERGTALSDLLRIEVAAVLGLSRPDLVAMDRPLIDQGCDPDRLVSLTERLAGATGLRLPIGAVTGLASPTSLARALDTEFSLLAGEV